MPSTTAIFTICSNNYLAQAGVFFESVRQHLPDADLFLALADEPSDRAALPGDVSILRADTLDIADFSGFAFAYGVMEFNTAIKPYAFLKLFERGYREVLYFDPDIMLFSGLDSVSAGLSRKASFILTPHLCSPPGVDAPRTEFHVMRTGVFNLGFLACSASAETETILRWWARKLRHDCVNDQAAGVFVDQKYMDLVPGFADRAIVLRDTSMNVAYWNLPQRMLDRKGDGWTVDERPLGFFHFSGFDPRFPDRLSRHVPETPLSEPLRDLLASYADRLLAAGAPSSGAPYAYATFASGAPIPDIARRMYKAHQPLWSANPFTTYEAYLRSPSPHATLGQRNEIVTVLMERVHAESDELRARFDLHEPRQVAHYVHYFRQDPSARGIPDGFMPNDRIPSR